MQQHYCLGSRKNNIKVIIIIMKKKVKKKTLRRRLVPKPGLDERQQNMVQDGEMRMSCLLVEHKRWAAGSEKPVGGSASLEVLGTGWANRLGTVLASTNPALGLRDGPDCFSRSSQALVSVGEAPAAVMFTGTFPSISCRKLLQRKKKHNWMTINILVGLFS